MRTYIAAVLFLAAAAAGGRADDPAKADAAKLQGTWAAVSLEAGGQKLPAAVAQTLAFVVEGDALTIREGDRVAEKSTFTLDPAKAPRAIDWTVAGSGTAVPGIYEVDGDTLKLCWPKGGGERPAKFESKAGTELMFATFKRNKK